MKLIKNRYLKEISILLILISFGISKPLLSQSENKEFFLTDSVFNIGETYRFNPRFLYFTCFPSIEEEIVSETLKPIKVFFEKNPQLIVEVGGHTSTRGDSMFNKELSEKRALMIYNALIYLGVDSSRVFWRGYGEEEPIIPHEIIRKLKSSREREFAHRLNRRIELKIIAIEK